MKNLLIVGRGPIALEHAKAAEYLGLDVTILARKEDKQRDNEFKKETDVRFLYDENLKKLPQLAERYEYIIIAVDIFSLDNVLCRCIKAGFSNILIEKPGFVNASEIVKAINESRNTCKIFIAYNRRGLPSVMMLKDLLSKENILSIKFEFTELIKVVEEHWTDPTVLENWTWLNSTHIFDLCEYLSDEKFPTMMHIVKSNSTWHKAPKVRILTGLFGNNVPFSGYSALGSGGRWSVDVDTDNGRYSLCPMEELSFYSPGDFAGKILKSANGSTTKSQIKPGFVQQLKNFLLHQSELRTIAAQIDLYKLTLGLQNENFQ